MRPQGRDQHQRQQAGSGDWQSSRAPRLPSGRHGLCAMAGSVGRRRHQSPPSLLPAPICTAAACLCNVYDSKQQAAAPGLSAPPLSPPRRAARSSARLQTVQVAPQVRARAAEGRAAGRAGEGRSSPCWPLCLKLPGLAGGLTAHPTMLYGLGTGGSGLQACRRASETHAPACPQVPVPWLVSSSGCASG